MTITSSGVFVPAAGNFDMRNNWSSGSNPRATNYTKRSNGDTRCDAGCSPRKKTPKSDPGVHGTLSKRISVKGYTQKISDNSRPKGKQLCAKRIKHGNTSEGANHGRRQHDAQRYSLSYPFSDIP